MNRLLKDFFVPCERNNFRAKLLHPSFLALLVGFFLFNQTVLSLVALTRPGVLGYTSDILPEAIIRLTNEEREKEGLSALEENGFLNEAARRKAADMFAFDYWAHSSPAGKTPWSFFKEAGYNYVVAGENLAKDFSNPEAVVGAWMKSPTHKANIADNRFKEIGVAVVEGTLNGYQTTLVVQLFGTPSRLIGKRVVEAKEQSPSTSFTPASDLYQSGTGLGAEEMDSSYLTGIEPSEKIVNPLAVTKVMSAFLFGLITGAILVDAYFILKSKVRRSSGRSLAHAGFLAVIFFLIFLSQQGVIN